MSDMSYKIGTFRGVEIRKLRASGGVPALYLTGAGETCASLRFALHTIEKTREAKK